jgi:hypothetical protein
VAVVQVLGGQLAVGPALHTPCSHTHPALGQVAPQSRVPPHPSPMAPQYLSPLVVLQVKGTQVDEPLHKLLLQVQPALAQVVPQSNVPPHLLPMVPQYWSPLAAVQVMGVHTSGPPLQMWSSPQVQPAGHESPQSREPPHPSPTTPQ